MNLYLTTTFLINNFLQTIIKIKMDFSFDVSFDCYVCDHLHYTEHFHIGTKAEIALVAHQSLSSIIEWHKTLTKERDDLLKNKSLSHYIVFNRMENIKRVLNVFRENGDLQEDLATNYAIIHMVIEHDMMDKEKLTFPNIYKLFKQYIMATYDCLNFVDGGHHPTSNELIGVADQINKLDSKDNNKDDQMSR